MSRTSLDRLTEDHAASLAVLRKTGFVVTGADDVFIRHVREPGRPEPSADGDGAGPPVQGGP